MTSSGGIPTCALPPFLSLVRRSLEAWGPLRKEHPLAEGMLQRYADLDDFLGEKSVMFWFFQQRESFLSQGTMTKWGRDRLDHYILLPGFPGFVTRRECFFVSHFWQTRDHPDPFGTHLRLHQNELRLQPWSYIWVDWTCIPQHPRSQLEELYFLRALKTMPGIIRNCGFSWFYPPFEARLWILFEITEYTLTCEGELAPTADIAIYREHIREMVQVGVQPTLERHGYRCTFERDKEFLTSWMEVLVLIRRLGIDVLEARRVMDNLTWPVGVQTIARNIAARGVLRLQLYEGIMTLGGERYTFKPFPKWEDGKYSKTSSLRSASSVTNQ
ncbi:hypothetical protein F5Y14DRAFT_396827 [Nemania sp. NC0429]|nr:hypothetical protein F5Y14DRAFT_396827 [Nemania sp. NC0429]